MLEAERCFATAVGNGAIGGSHSNRRWSKEPQGSASPALWKYVGHNNGLGQRPRASEDTRGASEKSELTQRMGGAGRGNRGREEDGRGKKWEQKKKRKRESERAREEVWHGQRFP